MFETRLLTTVYGIKREREREREKESNGKTEKIIQERSYIAPSSSYIRYK